LFRLAHDLDADVEPHALAGMIDYLGRYADSHHEYEGHLDDSQGSRETPPSIKPTSVFVRETAKREDGSEIAGGVSLRVAILLATLLVSCSGLSGASPGTGLPPPNLRNPATRYCA